MKIPPRLLRDSLTVQPHKGHGGVGPIYDASVTLLGKVSMTQQLTTSASGSEVLSEMTVYLDPDDATFAPDSRVTFGTRTGTVISVGISSRPGEAVLAKVLCT